MGSARRIVIEFLGEDKNLGSTTADLDGKTSRLGSTLAKVGKVAAVGMAAGAVIAGKAMFDMTRNAMEDDAAQRKLALSMKNTVGATDAQIASTEKWISRQGRALGVTDDELRPAFQRLVEATGSVDEAQRQMGIAMDVSAGTGKSLKTVSEALMKANNGTTASLSKLGLKTKDANGETLSLDQALKSMADTFEGQAAAKANTLEGKIGRLKLIFDETKETIGSKLIPVVTRLADWFLNEGLPAIQRFGDWFSNNLAPTFRRIGEVINTAMGSMRGDVGGNLGRIREIVQNVTSIITSLWERFGDGILTHARIVWRTIKAVIDGALDIIAGVVKVFASVLKGDWDGAWDGVKQIVRGAWTVIRAIVEGSLDMLKNLMREAWGVVKDIARGAWDGVREIIANGVERVMEGIRALPERIRNLAGSFSAAGHFIIDAFVDGLKNAAGVIAGIASNVWTALRSMLNSAITRINSALEFTISIGPKSFSINPPDIPMLATGGIVRARPGGTLAILGEGGHDEAVVPLSGPHAPRMGAGAGSNFIGTVAVDLQLDGRTMQTVLLKLKRSTGGQLGLA